MCQPNHSKVCSNQAEAAVAKRALGKLTKKEVGMKNRCKEGEGRRNQGRKIEVKTTEREEEGRKVQKKTRKK